MAVARRLSFGRLRQNVYEVIRANSLSLCKFSILNMAFLLVLTLGLGGVGSLWFLAWGLGYYLFHFMFFRWFFAKKPPLLTLKFFDTLLPAVKVMFMVMLGLTVLAYFPYFPLLIKLIDAKDRLSVQVHPDDEYALKNEGEFGKGCCHIVQIRNVGGVKLI